MKKLWFLMFTPAMFAAAVFLFNSCTVPAGYSGDQAIGGDSGTIRITLDAGFSAKGIEVIESKIVKVTLELADPYGKIITNVWRPGDDPVFTYPDRKPGIYSLKVTELDEAGFTKVDSKDINVRKGYNVHVYVTVGANVVIEIDDGAADEPVKHVILFIGDGMQLEHEIAASRYLYGKDFGLTWHYTDRLFGYEGFAATWDVSSYNTYAQYKCSAPPYDPLSFNPLVGYNPALGGALPYPLAPVPDDGYFFDTDPTNTIPDGNSSRYATDSASAGTAIATGVKTDDGNVSWKTGDPADGRITTICEELKEKGWSIGVVSTVPFTHATPAVFVSHNKSRNNYVQIAEEIIRATKPDVVIGGGHWNWSKTYMSEAQYTSLKNGSTEYRFVERRPGVSGGSALLAAAEDVCADNAPKKKLFGLFGGNGGNFESPVPQDSPGFPQVRIGSDENPWLADCVNATLKVLSRNRNGFFVMFEQGDIDWSNHALDFGRMVGCVYDLDKAVKAAVEYIDRPGDGITWGNTLLIVTSDHANSYMRLNPAKPLGKGDLPAQVPSAVDPVYGPQFNNGSYPGGEVSYRKGEHTNELVTLYALGSHALSFAGYEGKWYPGTRIIDNTDIYRVMKNATGLFVTP